MATLSLAYCIKSCVPIGQLLYAWEEDTSIDACRKVAQHECFHDKLLDKLAEVYCRIYSLNVDPPHLRYFKLWLIFGKIPIFLVIGV
jgi:hypothetical protein